MHMQQVEDEDLKEFQATEVAQRERDYYKRDRNRLQRQLDDVEKKMDLLVSIDSVNAKPPKWLTPKPAKGRSVGIVNLMISDTHFDEVVKPEQVNGVNAYNREIATQRWTRLIDKTCEMARDYITGIEYEGIHIWANGDIFSGNIHDELKETNEAPIMATLDYWVDPVVAGIKQLRDQFGVLHFSGRVGNHGRNTRKPVAKNRVEDNFDWLFYRILARELHGSPGITWDLPLSSDGPVVTQYTTRYMATHGDQFHGGAGIAGIMTPLALGDHKKSKRQAGTNDPYDYLLLGHFHTYMTLPRIIVNGSLKGLDEYAFQGNFGFEVPKQAFWITTPEHGPSFHLAILPGDRKAEGW